jgi:hypothetical protein
MLSTEKLSDSCDFRYIFEKLPVAETLEDLEALLPWNLNRDKLLAVAAAGG